MTQPIGENPPGTEAMGHVLKLELTGTVTYPQQTSSEPNELEDGPAPTSADENDEDRDV